MIDFARITVKAGDGGRGVGSFRGLNGKKYGKADGGDGGMGGNVYVEATGDVNSLDRYRFVKDYQAESGQAGLSRLRRGAQGADLVIKVPIGTVVKVESQSEESKIHTSDFDYDLHESGQRVLVARGGQGGRGNAHLRDEFGRRPRSAEVGQIGEFHNLTLELKMIADVGLIGLPNAGKSTLISKLTAAKPRVAAYPFTTLEANLGVMQVSGLVGQLVSREKLPTDPQTHKPTNLVLADIPGLIEGASQGKGLGDLFLKHIERTKVLVHLVDLSQDNLWDVYQTVRGELKTYSADLVKKHEIVVLTKADLVDSQAVVLAKKLFGSHRKKTFVISAQTGQGLEELKECLVSSIKY